MLFSVLLFTYSLMSLNPVDSALESFSKLQTYSVTLRSESGGVKEEIKYYYMKPGFVRMEFITPHRGAVLVYNPNTGKVRLKPFGFSDSFILELDPDSSLIRSSKGHTVEASDIGALLERVKELKEGGTVSVEATETLNGRSAHKVAIDGKGNTTRDGIAKYLIWFDTGSFMPLKVVAYGVDGEVSEEVLMDDIEVDRTFSKNFFRIG